MKLPGDILRWAKYTYTYIWWWTFIASIDSLSATWEYNFLKGAVSNTKYTNYMQSAPDGISSVYTPLQGSSLQRQTGIPEACQPL